MPKITKSVVDELVWTGKQIPVWDSEIKGLGVRVTPAGVKSFVFQYRHAEQTRRVTIAKAGTIEPARARARAKELAAMVAMGRDPQAEREAKAQAAAAERRRQKDTFERVAADFIERHAKQNRSWPKTQGILARHVLPEWGARPVEEIKRLDVIDLLDHVKDTRGPGAANDVHSVLRKLFGWCVEREIIAASPVAGVRQPSPPKSRDRVLSPEELLKVWDASGQLGGLFGPFIQLLILTGQRRNEVAKMRWDQVDLEKATWTLKREDTKADREHVLPLPEIAVAILQSLRPQGGAEAAGFVFTSTGSTPISGFSKCKKRLDALTGVMGWELHDLRRTAATGMVSLGFSPDVVGRVLNHAPERMEGVTAIYNRHRYQVEMRKALEAWAARVTGIAMEGKVVQLRA